MPISVHCNTTFPSFILTMSGGCFVSVISHRHDWRRCIRRHYIRAVPERSEHSGGMTQLSSLPRTFTAKHPRDPIRGNLWLLLVSDGKMYNLREPDLTTGIIPGLVISLYNDSVLHSDIQSHSTCVLRGANTAMHTIRISTIRSVASQSMESVRSGRYMIRDGIKEGRW
jgi:hypothetical protein